jgi:hypothetical protein
MQKPRLIYEEDPTDPDKIAVGVSFFPNVDFFNPSKAQWLQLLAKLQF